MLAHLSTRFRVESDFLRASMQPDRFMLVASLCKFLPSAENMPVGVYADVSAASKPHCRSIPLFGADIRQWIPTVINSRRHPRNRGSTLKLLDVRWLPTFGSQFGRDEVRRAYRFYLANMAINLDCHMQLDASQPRVACPKS